MVLPCARHAFVGLMFLSSIDPILWTKHCTFLYILPILDSILLLLLLLVLWCTHLMGNCMLNVRIPRKSSTLLDILALVIVILFIRLIPCVLCLALCPLCYSSLIVELITSGT